MRPLFLLLLLCTACTQANQHPLAHTSADDPVWRINPDRWGATENALTSPPTLPAGRIPAPQAAR